LTIPFLFGTYEVPSASNAIEESAAFGALSSLLLSFRDATPEDHSVVIAECVDLREPIVALYPPAHGRSDCEALPGRAGGAPKLYVQRPYLRTKKPSVDSVLEVFWGRFGNHLTCGEFSFRANHYSRFNAQDRLFIERALGNQSIVSGSAS
jgi:hypothetical protein